MVDSEVRACVCIVAVNGFVHLFRHATSRPSYSNRCWRQIASRNAALGQSEFHRDDPTPGAKDTCPISINGRLNLSSITRYNYFECANIDAIMRDTVII